jgi:hypothetical protein
VARCAWTECGRWWPTSIARRLRGGVVMNEEWYCSRQCAEVAFADELVTPEPATTSRRPQALPPLKLGMLLVHQGAITPADLRGALDAQRSSGQPLGRELVHLGRTDEIAVLRALAGQAGVPFLATLHPSAVRACPEILAPAAVRALGLVPFGLDVQHRRMKTACQAPVPRLALAALTEITGWVAEPFLVTDASMPSLVEAYERSCQGLEVGSATWTTAQDAPAKVAALAAETPDATVNHATWAPYVWVRVQGTGVPRDLFVSAKKETPWPAAHTSH